MSHPIYRVAGFKILVPYTLEVEFDDNTTQVIDFHPILKGEFHGPYKRLWYSYDEEADVLYFNFKKPSHADDSELTDDDVIIRYENGEVIGITVLNASHRVNP